MPRSAPLLGLCALLALAGGLACSSSSPSQVQSGGAGGTSNDTGGDGGMMVTGGNAGLGGSLAGSAGNSAGTAGGGAGGSQPTEFQVVHVFQTSRSAGDGGVPEHCDALSDLLPQPPNGTTASVVTVDTSQPRQTFIGFGAAITEVTASTIAILPQDRQDEIYDAYFSPQGSGYVLTRTHIGSCDFSLSEYTYDDVPGDTALESFSIENDETYLIPGLQQAMAAAGGELKVLASAWSAPAWMKTNNSLYDGKLLPENYGVFASYLSRYVQAYAAAGVPIWSITPTNEPLGVGGARESMVWTAAEMNTFLRDHLGPTLAADNVEVQTFIFDHNKETTTSEAVTWAQLIYGDPLTNPLVAGSALHWYDSTYDVFESELDALHDVAPDKPILFDEGTADGFIFNTTQEQISLAPWFRNDEWFWTKSNYDWGYVYADKALHPAYESVHRYARDIIVGLNHWYVGWIDWNAVLNKFGALDAANGGTGTVGDPGVSHLPNGVPAGIMVDTALPSDPVIYYTPIFYTLRQFSRFIRPGAQIATTTVALAGGVQPIGYDGQSTPDGRALLAVGAQNADGSVAVVLFNQTSTPIDVSVHVGGQAAESIVPSQAIQTLLWQ